MDAEIVIRGGTVVDGTGAPGLTRRRGRRRRAHRRRRRRACAATRELDAGGQVVAPGFIDIHTHYDAQVFWDPRAHAVRLPRRHDRRRRQLRVLDRAGAPRRRRPARPHAAARRGHELRHPGRRRPVGRVRDLPPVPRRRRAPRGRPQLRLLRRPHRRAALRHGRRRLRAPGHRRRARRHAARSSPTPWPPGRSGSPPAPRPPTTVPAGGRCPPGSPTSPRCRRCWSRCAIAGTGRRRAAARRGDPQGRGVRAAAAHRPARSPGPRCSTIKGLPYHEGVIAASRRGLGRRRGGVAAGLVPAADVPDEPHRAVHAQHAPSFAALMDVPLADADRRLPRPGVACRRVGGAGGRRRHAAGELGGAVGRRGADPARPRRPAHRRPRRGAGRHPARRAARHRPRRRPAAPVHVGARQRRPRRHRLAAAAGTRPHRPRRLGRARQPALRRLLRHRPARPLGARPGGDAARAGGPQAHRRARPASTA